MFRSEIVRVLSETLVETGIYFVLFILPLAVCMLRDLHSACSVL